MPVDLTPIIMSGVLDNTLRDTIRLELHVPFIKEPFRFSLSGNCLRDAAGRKVEFRRKEEMPPASLRHVPLYGLLGNLLLSDSPLLAGDMTFTRRASRTTDSSVIPNLLSIEFFEGSQRRYLIEGDCFSFHVSKPAWKCTQSCESAQEILNMSVLRDMIHVQVNQFRGSFYNELGDDMPSCKWDRVLNRAEAYLVAAEMVRRKYATHPRRRLAEAFVLDQVDSLNKWATLDEEGTDITPAASTKWEFTDFMKPAEVRRVLRRFPLQPSVFRIGRSGVIPQGKRIEKLSPSLLLQHGDPTALYHHARPAEKVSCRYRRYPAPHLERESDCPRQAQKFHPAQQERKFLQRHATPALRTEPTYCLPP